MEVETSAERQFAEDFSLVFARFGLPRMAGRILGWLLVCDPPQQSSTQLRAALNVSKGAVSTSTRLLESLGLLEKAVVPGVRGYCFEVRPDSFLESHNVIGTFQLIVDLLDTGLEIVGDPHGHRADRLRMTRDLYVFLGEEYPKMREQFLAERAFAEEGENGG